MTPSENNMSLQPPLISVITVCRNAAPQLAVTAESVRQQKFNDFEFLIIDGASTDNTLAMAASFETDFARFVSEPDSGIYDAMNKGSRLALGQWVIFMNAGDTFASPSVLADLAAMAADCDDSAGVIYGDVIRMTGDNGTLLHAGEPCNSHRMFFCHQSAMTRRSLLLRYPFDTSCPLSADFKFYKTLIRRNISMKKINIPVACFDTTGISSRRRSAGLADNMRVILQTDGPIKGLPFLARLFPVWLVCKLRGR